MAHAVARRSACPRRSSHRFVAGVCEHDNTNVAIPTEKEKAFASAVLKSLEAAMPRLSGYFGRVRISFLVREDGRLTNVKVIKSADNKTLAKIVIESARSSTVPRPPADMTPFERTFTVDYVYTFEWEGAL